MKASILAVSVAAIGLAVAVSACGGSASTTQASSSPTTGPPAGAAPAAPASASAAVPAGYQRIGGAAQGLSLAVPSSWVTINFPQQSIQQGLRKGGVHRASQATLTHAMQALQKLHGLYAVNIKSMASSR